jgi:S-layer protein
VTVDDTAMGAKLTLGDASSFANYLDAASAGTTGAATSVVKWFQFGGNTFVVVDNSNALTFQDGDDGLI